MASLCKPFTKARVMFFDSSAVDAAWKWLQENEEDERAKEENDRRLETLDSPDTMGIYPWFGV